MSPNEIKEPEVEHDPRVIFAAERTLLAWIRTGLALMGFGFVVAKFGLFMAEMVAVRGVRPLNPGRGQASLWVGVMLVAAGVMMNLVATVGHVRTMRRLREGTAITPNARSAATTSALLLAAMGVALACYLLIAQ